MDYLKTGEIIAKLRKEKGMTQSQLAEKLNISNKTVSKWETGKGAPDIDLIGSLATVLEADAVKLLAGNIAKEKKTAGKVERTKFHVCTSCGNFYFGTGEAGIYCCGRQLLPAKFKKAESEHKPVITKIGDEWFVELGHDMKKDHYIMFAAYVSWDKLFVVPMYPEQSASFYMPAFPKGGSIYFYCSKHGLFRFEK